MNISSATPNNTYTFTTILLSCAALCASLFFNGLKAEFFALAMCLLLIWVAVISWTGFSNGQSLPKGPVITSLAIYQLWLFLTLFWNPVTYLGINYFLLLATPLIIVFTWAITPSPEKIWAWMRTLLLILGTGLMIQALYQYYWQAELPHATFVNRNSLAAMLTLWVFLAFSQVISRDKETKLKSQSYVILCGISVAALIIGLISSRGAFLGLVCALLTVIMWSKYQAHAKKQIWLCTAAVVLGIGASNLPFLNVQDHALLERMETLSNPYAAGNDRFLIWAQSLEMAKEKPFAGYGLGTYWQHWPQWRDPADMTSGYWAHNDFLHLWIEAGLPAVFLLLVVHFCLAIALFKIIKNGSVSSTQKGELVALFAGLLAISIHTQFTYHYYNLPIVIVLSLFIARISRVHQDLEITARPASPRWLRITFPVLSISVALYFIIIGSSVKIFEDAARDMADGNLEDADKGFMLAQKLWGTTDTYLHTHALLKEKQLASTPVENIEERKRIYQEAKQLLDTAIQNNPLRPIQHYIHGRVIVTAADIAGEDWIEKAEIAFKESIARDPRYLEPRITLAQIYNVTNRQPEALNLLEGGADYYYQNDNPNTLTYYKMIATSRHQAGDMKGAMIFADRYNNIVKALQNQPED